MPSQPVGCRYAAVAIDWIATTHLQCNRVVIPS